MMLTTPGELGDRADANAKAGRRVEAPATAKELYWAALSYQELLSIPDDASDVVAHALQTFGSVRKALGWLNDQCWALDGAVPLQLILAGRKQDVEDELVRIEHGVYV
jgi:hypothetical protein